MNDELAARRSPRRAVSAERRPVPVFPAHPAWVAALLYGCAAVQIVVGLPLALGVPLPGTSGAETVHLVRDGTLACLLGIVLVVVARRPRWSRPLTIVAVAIFVVQLVGSTGDLAAGNVRPTFELVHLVSALGVAVAAMATVRTRPRMELRVPEDEESRERGN